MLSARTNGAVTARKRHDLTCDDEKYNKKKKLRRNRAKQNYALYKGVSCFCAVLFLCWYARNHWSWKKQQLKLARLKRAYSLEKFRQRDTAAAADKKKYRVGKDETLHQSLKSKKKNVQFTNEKPQPQKLNWKDAYSSDDLTHATTVMTHDIVSNRRGGVRFVNPKWLPTLPGFFVNPAMERKPTQSKKAGRKNPALKAFHRNRRLAFEEEEWDDAVGPRVDYTLDKHYEYAPRIEEPPAAGGYPHLEPLGTLMSRWPQDAIDTPPVPIKEQLQRFDFSNPSELAMAIKFREKELPFKVYNVPELEKAGPKWTDEYLAQQFDGPTSMQKEGLGRVLSPLSNMLRGGGMHQHADADLPPPPKSAGSCQESNDNFFSFYIPASWDIHTMGLPPTRGNDFNFQRFASHARYADATRLSFDRPHFYWTAGVPPEERMQPKSEWGFISRDLPSWSSPESNFFMFEVESQKGIQCRFGERGVTAATHYDGGRNMVAMVTGAKRYILSPPNQCSKLGIIKVRGQPAFRHSLLNFAHLEHVDQLDNEMSTEERQWLDRAKSSLAVETVLKAGEVLYIPSHWFHYITSLQRSAQCNARSGRERAGTAEFGGFHDVDKCE